MKENPETVAPKKVSRKRRQQKRSAWILSGIVAAMMVPRLASGLMRPIQAQNQATVTVPTATAVTAQGKAEAALTTFFTLLDEQRYEEATTYYGGSYDVLVEYNPDDAANHGALLRDACTRNGFQCLPLKRVHDAQAQADGSYVFTVTFAQDDGSLLTQPTDSGGTRSEFAFRVMPVNGRYLVQDLPVYLP